MIPIRDDNPVRGIPVVTILTILACLAVYLWQLSLPPQSKQTAINLLGFMPALLFGYARLEGALGVAGGLDLHGDVPARRVFSSRRQHAVSVDLRR